MSEEAIKLAQEAFRSDDPAAFHGVLERYPALKAKINDPVGAFDSPLIINVRSRAMLDVLLDAGAKVPEEAGGTEEVRAVLRRRGAK